MISPLQDGSKGRGPPSRPSSSQCPQGHELQVWAARAGHCDGCLERVEQEEEVMDCRRCNFYLCRRCLRPEKAKVASSWSVISSLPFYTADAVCQDVSTLAGDVARLVSASIGLPDDAI